MKILEIKNNLVKISYDMDDNLALSGFVIIEDTNCPYVAQVVSLKVDNPINTAIVRLLFTFDTEGVLKNYNGTIPSLKASISKLPSNELLDVMPVETPIKLGALAQQGIPLFVDKTAFERNIVICCNKQENINTFVNNMLPQFNSINQKTVVIDTDGEFDYENKFEFSYDFKLPLNYKTLEYIFDNDLEDVDATSKAVIQDIFYEVQEYSKTLPLGFIPFNTFLALSSSKICQAMASPSLSGSEAKTIVSHSFTALTMSAKRFLPPALNSQDISKSLSGKTEPSLLGKSRI